LNVTITTTTEHADTEHASGIITIKVPNAQECLPERARPPQGLFHVHPYWSPIVTDGGVNFPEKRPLKWEFKGASAITPVCQTNFRRRQYTFSYLSLKNGHSQTGESAGEQHRAKELEVDPNIVDYSLGGIRLRYDTPNGQRVYTPDSISVSADGQITVEEVKASGSYFAVPDYGALMRLVGKDLQRLGVVFSKRHSDEICEQRVRCFNVSTAFDDRFTKVSPHQWATVLNVLTKESAGASLDVITEALALPYSSSRKIVNAMMCKRALAYDLNQPLTRASQITTAPKVTAPLPDLRSIRL
jgi:hypothetical protein